MYFVHNQADNVEDSYFNYTVNGSMTVLGLGRHIEGGNPPPISTPLLTTSNNVFTIGLSPGDSDTSAAAATIRGAYKDLTTTLGAGSVKPS
jgi:hypothetical protein